MILQNHVKCDNCHSITKLRIGLGTENKGFKFFCEKCNQEIIIELFEEFAGQSGSIRSTGGELVDNEDYSYIFNYHSDFPLQTKDELLLSPFLIAAQRYGDSFHRRILRKNQYSDIISKKQIPFKRIVNNYRLGDWSNLTDSIRTFLPNYSDNGSEENRLCSICNVIEVINEPIFISNYNSNIQSLLSSKITFHNINNSVAFKNLMSELKIDILPNNILKISQYFIDFYEFSSNFSQIIIEWDPENPDTFKFPNVLNNPKSSKIIEFYKDGYELIAQNITTLIGIMNLERRGNFNSFPRNPYRSKEIFAKNIRDFHLKENGPKFDLLKEEPVFFNWITPPIDKNMRNAIGHKNLEYDEINRLITYSTKNGRTFQISYENFLLMCLGILYRLYQLNTLNKNLFNYIISSKI